MSNSLLIVEPRFSFSFSFLVRAAIWGHSIVAWMRMMLL
jgi:hypothetical protein